MQYFRRSEEKGGNAPRREPKADAASDVLTRGWENRDRNNIRHRHALRRRRLRRARKRRAKRQKFKNTLRSCLTSPSTTWVIIASFRMPGSSRSKKRGDAVTGKQDGESAKESGPEEQSQRSEQDRPRADRQQFDGAGALKRRQESLRHQVPSGSRAEWQKAKKASIGADRRARATIASIRSRRRAAGRPLDRLPSTDCERIRRRKLASLEAWLVLVSLRIDLGTSWILYSTQAMKYGRKTTVPSRLSSP